MRPASGEDGWFSLARGDLCGGCHTCWVGRKSQNRKIVPPYVEKPFNSKVIKKFPTWTKKSLRVFRISRFLCDICYICNEHPMYISHIHIMAMVQCEIWKLSLLFSFFCNLPDTHLLVSCIWLSLLWIWSHDFCHLSYTNLIIVDRQCIVFLHGYVSQEYFFSALSAFSFPYIPI